ncbi:MAG: vitamin K epoxide reductase family protein, partial [Actinomycetota bacterium]|nr:vitamin K epoxide reductase family protein [Actinomycetota bacterium]
QDWYLWGLLAGTVAGTVFIHWLAIQTPSEIGALCLYCVAVWIATLTALGAVASACLSYLLPSAQPGRLTSILSFTYDWMPVLVAMWISVLAIVVTVGLVN